MTTPFAQPAPAPDPGVAEVVATMFQLAAEPAALHGSLRCNDWLAPLDMAMVGPSMVVPEAFFSVYVSLPLICGNAALLLMKTTFEASVRPQKVWNCAYVA